MAGLSLAGRLLISSPYLADPNFFRTVVLMLEHNQQGALGVVLNRPTTVQLVHALPGWEALASTPAVVFAGGPVERNAAVGLARARDGAAPEALRPLLDGVGVIDLGADPAALRDEIDEVRIFSGYAGWGEGQLENELASAGWIIVDAAPDEPLSRSPSSLWNAAIQRARASGQRLPGSAIDPGNN